MHFLFFAIGAVLIAWGASDIALNVLDEGIRPLIVTYGGVANTAIGFILMGLGRCVQLLQNMQGGASSTVTANTPVTVDTAAVDKDPAIAEVEPEIEADIQDGDPVQADLREPELGPMEKPELGPLETFETAPDPKSEPEPQPVEVPDDTLDELPSTDRGQIVKQGDIRGYPFHLYENGEIELETKSGWHTFSTIEEVQSHLAAEARNNQDSDGK